MIYKVTLLAILWCSLGLAQKLYLGGDFTLPADETLYAGGNLEVASGTTFDMESGAQLTVEGNIDNQGTVKIANQASLIQTVSGTDGNTNGGNYEVSREATYANQRAFKYWSSPVSGEEFDDVFDNTNLNDAYQWVPAAGGGSWQGINGTYTFLAGRSVITTPEPFNGANASAITETRTFTGNIHNGDLGYSPANSLNPGDYIMAGNPYPCALDNNAFVTDNTNLSGTLHFWNQTIFAGAGGQNSSSDYAAWNGVGSTNTGNGSKTPADQTAAMQGFFVQVDQNVSNGTNITVNYNNAQREGESSNTPFFKNQPSQNRQRLWLRATNDSGAYNQLLIGLLPQATDGYDRLYDGRKLKGNPHLAFYSVLKQYDLAIQGLDQDLKADKVIPLGLDAGQTGRHTIALDSLDNWPGHTITLLDSVQGTVTDLQENDYHFAVNQPGAIRGRFFLFMSAAPLSTQHPPQAASGELVYFPRGNALIVDSRLQNSPLDKVALRSIDGRLLRQTSPQTWRHQIPVGSLSKGIYLLETRTRKGTTTRRKVYLP